MWRKVVFLTPAIRSVCGMMCGAPLLDIIDGKVRTMGAIAGGISIVENVVQTSAQGSLRACCPDAGMCKKRFLKVTPEESDDS